MSGTFTHVLRRRRFRKVLAFLVFFTIALVLIIVPVEQAGNGKIKTHFDALWWASTTVTTVGYGDYVPVTVLGRLIGMLLQVCGTVMFGVVIALFSISLNRAYDEHRWKRIQEHFERLEKMIQEIEKQSRFLIEEREKKR